MANFPRMVLTDSGSQLLADALNGGTLEITKVVIGSGAAGVITWPMLTNVVTPEDTLPILEQTREGNILIITTSVNNSAVVTPFWMREIGIYAKSTAFPAETLYSYTNAGDLGFYIPTTGGAFPVTLNIPLHLWVSTAENVTVEIDDGGSGGSGTTVTLNDLPQELVAMTADATPGTLAYRDGNGRFKAGLPGVNDDVANKGYVDGLIGDIESILATVVEG